MLKKILYTVLFFVLAAGTVYCWQQVGFSRKTAMFFKVISGDESAMSKGRGGPPMGENRGGGMPGAQFFGGEASASDAQAAVSGAAGGETGASLDMQPGAYPPSRPGGSGRPGGHGGPGGNISLKNVGMFTVIMAFAVMLTCLLDNWQRRFFRLRKARRTR